MESMAPLRVSVDVPLPPVTVGGERLQVVLPSDAGTLQVRATSAAEASRGSDREVVGGAARRSRWRQPGGDW